MISEQEVIDLYALSMQRYSVLSDRELPLGMNEATRLEEVTKVMAGICVIGAILGRSHEQIALDMVETMKYVHRESPRRFGEWFARANKGDL